MSTSCAIWHRARVLLFATLCSFIYPPSSSSQSPPPDTVFCQTELPTGVELDSLLARHQRFQDQYSTGGGVPLLAGLQIIPVQIHIVTRDDGTGGIMEGAVLTELGIVNMRFQGAGLIFIACSPANVINSTVYYDILGSAESDVLSMTYNVPNVLNIYFVNDAEHDVIGPACGWATFTSDFDDYVLMDNDCATNTSTLAHEIGHYFDLFHTHATQGGLEFADGTNCMIAGDLMCSTPADPNLSMLVDAACMYTGTALDPNLDPYLPDPTNLMSYSTKPCRDNFTGEQLAKASFTAANARSYVNIISCPADTNAYLDANCNLMLPDYRDLINFNLPCLVDDTTQFPAPGTILSNVGITMVTIMVTDANGDVSSCSFDVSRLDSIPPQIAMVSPDTIMTNALCEGILPDYRDSTTVTDNCDLNPFIEQFPLPGSDIGGVGTTETVYVVATDASGNRDSLGIEVAVIDSDTSSELNCLSLNLSIDQVGLAEFQLAEMVPGANCSELHTVSIQTDYGATVHQASNLIRSSLISFMACPFVALQLKCTVTNSEGASCWGYLTFKQSNGPQFFGGRNLTVFCTDPLVNGGDLFDVKPPALATCGDFTEVLFVADWITPYACDSDTAKVILREYESFDKLGRRGGVLDTIVVVKLPQLNTIPGGNLRNIGCREMESLYCGTNVFTDSATGITPIGPYLLLEEFPGNPDFDADNDMTNCDTIYFCGYKDGEFLDLLSDGQKCGLNVHKDVQVFGGICDRQYKVTIEIKQECYKEPVMLNCNIPVSDRNIQMLSDGYWRCEFWVTDIDTTPPLVQCKFLGEFFDGALEEDFTIETQTNVYGKLNASDLVQAFFVLAPTSNHNCSAYTYLPPVCVYDSWSGIKQVKATVEGVGTFLLTADASINCTLAIPDEDALVPTVDTFPGVCYAYHEQIQIPKTDCPIAVIYEVIDSCHLKYTDSCFILVKDQIKPVPVVDKGVTISLSDKKIWVDAASFDEGSWDNCGVDRVVARRADWNTACVNLCYDVVDSTDCSDPEFALDSAFYWIWTNGYDTLWCLDLEMDKHCDAVEAHYAKQLDWWKNDSLDCDHLLYNAMVYDLVKYATLSCAGNSHLDDESFHELLVEALGSGSLASSSSANIAARSSEVQDSGLLAKFSLGVYEILGALEICNGELALPVEDFIGDFDFASALSKYIDQLKNIGGGWSDAVPFSCDDACGPVTVEILVMDYWCNWSKAWTKVWVEDKTPIQVVKDVVDEENISCKTYKDKRYTYPGEIHPVALNYVVEHAKLGEQDAFDLLDEVFGGYCKAWRDPYGNYVDLDGEEIDCEISFYDSICDCSSYTDQVRIYDEHLGYIWKDSVITNCFYEQDTLDFQKGIVVVNCEENVHCEQEIWYEFDHCGQGYIFRKFKIWQGCDEGFYEEHNIPDSLRHVVDTLYRHQRIWVGNECPLNKYMFDVPGDEVIYSCNIEYDGGGNVIGDAGPENTGYATYKFDDDCRIVGIAHEDKLFKVVGGDAACYKILRTWYFADWCGYGGEPVSGSWWDDYDLVIDSCVQKIIVNDTTPPMCTITGPVVSGGAIEVGACAFDLEVTVAATDLCGLKSYYWELKNITDPGNVWISDSDNGTFAGDHEGEFVIESADLTHGSYKLKVVTVDECNNEGYCESIFDVVSVKKPSPVCVTSLTARLTPWDSDGDGVIDSAHAVVWAGEFDSSSEPACQDTAIEFRIEFITGDSTDESAAGDADSLALGCADFGTHLLRMWVVSLPSNTRDYCDVVLVVQSDLSGCQTTEPGEHPPFNEVAGMQENTQDPDKKIGHDGLAKSGSVNPGMGGKPFAHGFWETGYSLAQNVPNPFRAETNIGFVLPEAMQATITVYDVTGRIIRSMESDFFRGYNEVQFRNTDLGVSGVLYYRLNAGAFTATRKMIVME